MSSILRALKKVQDHTTAPPEMLVGPGLSLATQARERRMGMKWILATAVLMVVVFAGAWIFNSRSLSPSHTSNPHQVSGNPNVFSGSHSDMNASTHETLSPLLPLSQKHAISVLDSSARKSGLPADVEAESGHPNKDAQILSEASDVLIAPTETVTSETSILSQGEIPQSIIESEYDEISESADLKLQAISWAVDPKKRLAVINGTLCRENESVNGFKIKQINPDDVIVSNGVLTGKLMLKIR